MLGSPRLSMRKSRYFSGSDHSADAWHSKFKHRR
jgi:hypothetical protein